LAERDYREFQRELAALNDEIQELYRSLDIEGQKKNLEKLRLQTQADDFWTGTDKEAIAGINREISRLTRKIEPWEHLHKTVADAHDLMEMALSEMDGEMLDDIVNNIGKFREKFDSLETLELLAGEDDPSSAFITIHPGAGGTESQDWASMLFKMYIKWAENNDYETDIIDYMPGEEAGIKSATALIKGEFAYGLLKCERGIHRLVRISPFDSNKRRHTSFASVEVVPEVSEDIDIEINDGDLRIDTYRASGAGGQHVNKTDSAIRITHIPTGLVVQCQNERSQHKNKSFAMKVLKSKLYELKKKEMEEKKQEKIGEKKDISWGNQIRSYVFQPYTLVKDHRTGEEVGSVENVLDGDIGKFIYSYLRTLRKASK